MGHKLHLLRQFCARAALTLVGGALLVLWTTPAVAAERLLVFGDSLSAAYGINPDDGWVALLRRHLQPRKIDVINASVSGETSQGGASRISADLKRHQPQLLILALGANDGLRGLPSADTERNLRSIISQAQAAKVRVILVGIQIPPNYGADYAQSFVRLYPKLAKAYGLELVPFLLDGIADKLDFFQADRLHPTAAAQPRLLANVLPAVERSLAKKAP